MNLPLAPISGVILGACAAAGVILLPEWRFESAVMDSGLPAVFSAAAPPLGWTARLGLAAGAGALTGLFAWLAAFVLLGTRGLTIGRAKPIVAEGPDAEVPTPVIRRADAHPDAPPRAPLLATRDLGTPFLDVITRTRPEVAPQPAPVEAAPVEAAAPVPEPVPAPVATPPAPVPAPAPTPPPVYMAEAARVVLPDERPLPEDLDQPLSAFDPNAMREEPVPLPEAVAPLRPVPRPVVFDASERFETFELTPVRREPPRPRAVPDPQVRAVAKAETEATIHALLERLEQGAIRKGLATGVERQAPEPVREPRRRDPERGLEDALVQLRNLARRA